MSWHLPDRGLLESSSRALIDADVAQKAGEQVAAKLGSIGAPCSLERVVCGPQVMRVELTPQPGVLMRAFQRTPDDLAFELAAERVRVQAPLPGRRVVAVELPALERTTVLLGDLLDQMRSPLMVPLGLDVDGETLPVDLSTAPHMLIAGQTGAGKSVVVNAILCSLLARLDPDELVLLLIDPKRVELTPYEAVPHLLAPVADNPDTAISHLSGLIEVMEARYALMAQMGARDLNELNERMIAAKQDRIPYAVCVVDELADLMMASGKTVESLVVRLAQKGRAAGVHLILATQSPRVSVVTGLIKANMPTRVAMTVASAIDSRVILDCNGAESLLGRGDGLLSLGGLPPVRFQGALVTSEEIEQMCEWWRIQSAEADTCELLTI